ncbi:AMPKBI-domain-containing protein [Thozetella sp. PMI_491]|nr:AMPKBI-domain-containing protein [Thozetella sp. PMI_491]
MGNNPSAPSAAKPTTPSSSSSAQSQGQNEHKVGGAARRDNRHPIPVHNQRVAAPPEPSLAQVQGTTSTPSSSTTSTHRFKSLQPKSIASLNNTGSSGSANSTPASSVTSTRPVEVAKPPQQGATAGTTTTAAVAVPAASQPVAVPNSHGSHAHNSQSSPSEPRSPFSELTATAIMANSSLQDMSYLTRPPRMPLPIEEELHTPGSPILAPTDLDDPLADAGSLDSDQNLPRRSSGLSQATIDDDDNEELRVDKTRPTVPTRLEWLRGGEKVYVTGTIFQWNRKTRLHPVDGRPGEFAATIHILPGTHHVRFLVDGQMQTSPDLPTTVDFGNNLVNYIEVSPDDAKQPAATEAKDVDKPTDGPDDEPKAPKDRVVIGSEMFSHGLPTYLRDFDQTDNYELYQTAVQEIEKLPTPPSLPGFLGKPILNAATLFKDDNSVLNMPNHTVLNHLATSSIKNNILAVSATTRYKQKYVTTIIYKPTETA